jgi:hypothetical protein
MLYAAEPSSGIERFVRQSNTRGLATTPMPSGSNRNM